MGGNFCEQPSPRLITQTQCCAWMNGIVLKWAPVSRDHSQEHLLGLRCYSLGALLRRTCCMSHFLLFIRSFPIFPKAINCPNSMLFLGNVNWVIRMFARMYIHQKAALKANANFTETFLFDFHQPRGQKSQPMLPVIWPLIASRFQAEGFVESLGRKPSAVYINKVHWS